MQQNDKPVLIYATFPNAEVARMTGERLVRRRLAACVNVMPGITSVYWWEGEIQSDQEAAMIVKSRHALADEVVATIKAGHTYANPAVVVVDIAGGSDAYIAWIMAETAAGAAT